MPLKDFTPDEVAIICKECYSFRSLARALGYVSQGASLYQIKQYLEENCIDYSHFTHTAPNTIKRTPENIFIKNSTASQRTLRVHYLKGNYTPYKCAICGQEPFWNGKPMSLILDHINGYNNDDRLENLRWVCGNCDRQLPTTTGCNKKHGIRTEKYNVCIDCGRNVLKPAVRCFPCNLKHKAEIAKTLPIIAPNSGNTITREELKALIRKMPITHVAAKFGVSDNTIRKWCKRVDLPCKYADIHSLSDEEWQTI